MDPKIVKMYEGKNLKDEIQKIRKSVNEICGQDLVVVRVGGGSEIPAGDLRKIDSVIENDAYYTHRYDDFVIYVTDSKFNKADYLKKKAFAQMPK